MSVAWICLAKTFLEDRIGQAGRTDTDFSRKMLFLMPLATLDKSFKLLKRGYSTKACLPILCIEALNGSLNALMMNYGGDEKNREHFSLAALGVLIPIKT